MTTRRIVASLLALLLGAHPLGAVLPSSAVRGMSSACPTSAATPAAEYTYDDAGNLETTTYKNGIEAGYTYDAAYRLDVATWRDTATQQVVAQFDCDVNALGLRTHITEAVETAHRCGLDKAYWSGRPGISGSVIEERNAEYEHAGARLAGAYAERGGCVTHPRNCGACTQAQCCTIKGHVPRRRT